MSVHLSARTEDGATLDEQTQTTTMKKTNLIASVSASAAIAFGILYLAVTSPRRTLDRLLSEVATVEVGQTKLAEWRTQVERDQHSNVAVKCDQYTCAVGCSRENSLLRRLRLAPRTTLGVNVGFRNGIASEIYIILVIGKRDDKGEWRDDRGVVVRQSEDVPGACNPHFTLDLNPRRVTVPGSWATVAMDSCVSRQDRARAIAINSSCLTRIGGCKTVESMLPQVFARP